MTMEDIDDPLLENVGRTGHFSHVLDIGFAYFLFINARVCFFIFLR